MRKISLFLVFIIVIAGYSQPRMGSHSLIHTQSARTFDKGRLELKTNMNFFTRATEFVGSGNEPANFRANNYWLVAGNFLLTYGMFDHVDFTIMPRLYQDTHYSNEYNIPDDIFFTLKGGSWAFGQRKFYGSMMMNVRLATGEQHNYPFAEYASGATEYGFMGALSYYSDPYLPERSWNAHVNLGWWNHNEAGEVLYEFRNGTELTGSKNSSELQYALGFSYPTALFDYILEVNGINYLTQPDEFVYSRENWLYVTPSLRYKVSAFFSMYFGLDVRLIGDEDNTSGVPDKSNENLNLPNYSSWRVQMGFNLRILPIVSTSKSAAEIEREQFNERVEFFQKIVQERERTQDVQEELDRLKEERKKAEKELEELRQILQEEENK